MQATAINRSKAPGLADLLNYAAVIDNGVVLCKDGTLLAGWHYRGSDNHSAIAAELNYLAVQTNRTLKELGSGWMIHCDSIRVTSEDYDLHEHSHFKDPVSKAIEAERHSYFTQNGNAYESEYVFIVSYQPPLLAQAKFTDLMFEEDDGQSKGKKAAKKKVTPFERGETTLNYFKQRVDEIQSNLSSVISLKRMRGVPYIGEDNQEHVNEELLSYINRCVTGESHPINLPPIPMYLDTLLGNQEFWAGLTPKVGDNYIIPVAISGFPHESYPAILQALDTIDTEYRWSTRFIFLDAHEAEAELTKYKKKWKQKVRGLWDQVFKTGKGTVNTDALNMTAQAEAAINDVNSGEVAYGYYTSVLLFMGKNLEHVEEDAKRVVSQIKSLGFAARIENINAVEAYLGSLPGHSQENIRRPMMNTFNLSHLLPLSSIWAGEKNNPCDFYPANSPALMHCATHGNTPFRLNLHVGDLGHTLVLGPTGAGKSTFLGVIAAQFMRYQNAEIFAFDKGRSMMPLCKGVGGNHFDIAGETSDLAFSPLSYIKTQQDISWFQDWLETMLKLQGLTPTPAQRILIGEAIKSCIKTSSKTLSDLQVAVQDKDIKDALAPYCLGGNVGHLLDAEEDNLSVSRFNVFEIEALMELDDKARLPVLLYLFWRIEKSLKGQPSLLILDEAWLMLGHPVFKEKIREWLKVLRKANCCVVLATQSISDASKSGILDVLTESTATKIFLPNPEANSDISKPLYLGMGLNEREIGIISTGKKKRQYYYTSETGQRLFELALGPVALAFVGVSDKEGITKVLELEKEHGTEWPQVWLNERGVNYQLDAVESFSEK